jgi:hypothetical protein
MIITVESFGGLESFVSLLPPRWQVAYVAQRLGPVYPDATLRMPAGTFKIEPYVPASASLAYAMATLYRCFPCLPPVYCARPTAAVDVSAAGVL